MSEQDEYIKNAEILIRARTEQLRKAMESIEELSAALEPFRPDIVKKVREKRNSPQAY